MVALSYSQKAILAMKHLSRHDAVLDAAVRRTGVCTIVPHENYFEELVSSIISQQLSVKAAATIEARFKNLFDGDIPEPVVIQKCSDDELRQAGLSLQKVHYIQDLCLHVIDGRLDLWDLSMKSNDEVEVELTAVKGIAQWTAHMFMIFSLGRIDVLPVGDLGIRTGIEKLYGLQDRPTPEKVKGIARINNWHPYESFASWYVWQSLNL